jgi:hypothetical protein
VAGEDDEVIEIWSGRQSPASDARLRAMGRQLREAGSSEDDWYEEISRAALIGLDRDERWRMEQLADGERRPDA